MTSKEGREEALKRVSQCILQDRNVSYGDPEDNFHNIANLWGHFLNRPVLSSDTSALMILMKMARIKTNPGHLDSWIDIAGYALCQAGMLIRQNDAVMKTIAPSSVPQESVAASSDASPQPDQKLQEFLLRAEALGWQKETDNTHKTP